uniref:Uncharacterized protein n=1 Tax=viral metagenome TaxID=1070528 RepID=A0A6C0I2N2_9ZZZZ
MSTFFLLACIISATTHAFSSPPPFRFFGMIGPNIRVQKTTTLAELFMGDGIIQGVFFDGNGTMTPAKHVIQTDRQVFKANALRFPPKKMFPNLMGVANTAMLSVRNRTFALFERDAPYEIDIDMENKMINTIGKLELPCECPRRFSGHTKYDAITDLIHTIDYNILTRTVTYYKMTGDFTVLNRFSKRMKYLPIIHDFKVLDSGDIVVIESPFQIWPTLNNVWFGSRAPLVLRKDYATKIHVMGNHNPATYVVGSGFYCFHYGQIIETKNDINIFASLYDELDFNSQNLNGKYRHIILKKEFDTCFVKKNPILETMNLDFPVLYGDDHVILRRVIDGRIGGYVVCRGLEIDRVINLPDSISAYGEHVIREIAGQSYIMAFCQDGSLLQVNINDEKDIRMVPAFDSGVTLGFHSIIL